MVGSIPRGVPRSVFTAEYAELRRLLIDARQAAGVSQATLAARLGRPQSFVSKFERGQRRLDVIEFLEITRALKRDPIPILRRLLVAARGA